ncbi:MAG: L-2-amino-thiazoline-4-carboxylic acid hydrolase [Firmicutes bacterium]|nr:L-2-amino-thiazoline-4-carboxylic acid hydrolase [Bacillota bacterium]
MPVMPIHRWLFSKIKMVAGREEFLVHEMTSRFGADPGKLAEEALSKYAPPAGDLQLEKEAQEMSIHNWLYSQIAAAETREGAAVKAFEEKLGDAGIQAMREIYRNHGRNAAEALREGPAGSNPAGVQEAFGLLQNCFLDGMPCDQVVEVAEASGNRIEWHHADCLHLEHWKEAGVSGKTMCSLLGEWLQGFAAGLNPGIVHQRKAAIVNGSQACIDVYEQAS